MLGGQGKLGSQIVELKQAVEVSQTERKTLADEWQTLREHERKVSELQTDKIALLEELNKVKSAQAEIIKMEIGSVYVSGLRAQLEEMKSDRDFVEASKLEIERLFRPCEKGG